MKKAFVATIEVRYVLDEDEWKTKDEPRSVAESLTDDISDAYAKMWGVTGATVTGVREVRA